MEQSRVKNTSRNLIYAVILQIVKMALVFISRIIFVNKLGAAYLGVNGLFGNILGILSLADLGMTTALMYSLYKPLAENDEIKISEYMNYFKKIYNIIALVVFLIGVILIPFLKYLVNLPEEMPHIYLYYILLLLNSVISYLFVYKTTLLSADQKMYIINKYDTVFQFILFFSQTLILVLTENFALYLVINVCCTFVGNLFKAKKTEQIYPYLKNNKNLVLSKGERKGLFTNLYSLFFYKLGGVVQNNTDNILISIFAGTIAVGYYSNYSTIITYVTTFLTLIFTSLKASVGNFVISKNDEEKLKMFDLLEIYNFWIVGFCSICLAILIPDFIEICFGKEYILSQALLIWATLNFYTANIRQTLWIYRETTGTFKKTRYVTMATAILNVLLSIILGYYFGLTGVIAATVISRMIYAWWKEPIVVYKECFKASVSSYFINYMKRSILLVIIYIATYFICNKFNINNIYIKFIIEMIICLIIPGLIMFLVYRNNNALIYLKENIKRLKASKVERKN